MQNHSMMVVVHYQRISQDTKNHDAFSHYWLIKNLISQNKLSLVICQGFSSSIDLPATYFKGFENNKVCKLFLRIVDVLHRLKVISRKRRFEELLFDLFLIYSLRKTTFERVYFSKPLFPKSIKWLKRRNKRIITRASVCDPLLNYVIVRNQEIQLGAKSSGSYSDIRRAQRLSFVFHRSDKILVGAQKICPFTFQSFQTYGTSKLIEYESIYVGNKQFASTKDFENSDQLVFVHVAQMNIIKGTHKLIQEWITFSNLYSGKATLILVGGMDDIMRNQLEISEKHANSIKYVGFTKNPFEKYHYADGMILSSLSDAAPAVVLESMESGIPTFISEYCGFYGLVKNHNSGYCFNPYHDGDLANCLVKYSKLDFQKKQQLRNLNIELFNRFFTKKRFIEEHLSIFETF